MNKLLFLTVFLTGAVGFPIQNNTSTSPSPSVSHVSESSPSVAQDTSTTPSVSHVSESSLPVAQNTIHDSWNTVFLDDFSTYAAGSKPSPDKWTIETGVSYPGGPTGWGTGEIETYTDSTDNLVITPEKTLRITPQLHDGKWTSARIETTAAHDFACKAGHKLSISATVKLQSPSGNSQMGIWPAFWALGSDFRGDTERWPGVGEIDILESVNGANTAYQTVHCGVAPGGPCSEKNGVGSSTGWGRNAWHKIGVVIDRTNQGGDWKGEKISWLLDEIEIFSLDGTRINNETAWTALTRNRKFIILNVAVGGEMPSALAHQSTPTGDTKGGIESALEVGHVAIYSSS